MKQPTIDTARVLELAAEKLARTMQGIVPTRVYPPEDAAELIGIVSDRRAKTIREIPPEILPFVKVTPGGGRIGYLGRDLIAYVERQRTTTS